ncbi:MAG: DUF4342 domain-containing protein [Oscillospiraceae bacterium]|nr:DUF4342 domain-containing protein [Oscillospiraceae bacterium]
MNNNASTIVAKLKELVQKGNVSRILIRRGSNVLLNLPVTVGVAGAVVGLSAAKWLLIAGAVATLGFGCTVEIVKDDGQIVSVLDSDDGQKVRDMAANIVEDVKDAIAGEKKD